MSAYACPFVLVGTMTSCLGMFLCSLIIERTTNETYYKKRNGPEKSDLFWIQPGGQKVGEQVFNAFIGKINVPRYVQSNRAKRQVEEDYRLWVSVGLTIGGFIIQFVGLRGMHAAVTLSQLGSTVVMSIIRASLRSQRMSENDNMLAKHLSDDKKRLLKGHELDWIAMHLNELEEFEVLIPYDPSIYPGTKEPSNPPSNNDHGSSSSDTSIPAFLRTLMVRARLARLTSSPEAFSWEDMELREIVRRLQASLQDSMDILYTEGDFVTSKIFKIPVSYNSCGGKGGELIELKFSRDDTSWKTEPSALEALLGLWTWSKLVKLPEGDFLSFDHIRVVAQGEDAKSLGEAKIECGIWIPTLSPFIEPDEDAHLVGLPDGMSLKTLGVRRQGSTLLMCAHDLFITSLTAMLPEKTSIEGSTDLRPADNNQRSFQLLHSGIESLVHAFTNSGLGTRYDAYMCIVPVLRRSTKLPGYSEISGVAREAVESCKRDGRHEKAENILKWYSKICEVEYRKIWEIYLLEFYCDAMLNSDSTEQAIGWRGMVNIQENICSPEVLRQAQSCQEIAIQIARRNQSIAHYADSLQKKGVNDAQADEFDKNKSVAKWSKLNNLLAVRYFLRMASNGVNDVDFSDETRKSPLVWAAFNGNDTMARFLLSQQTVDFVPDSDNRGPLSHASEKGHSDIIAMLLEKGDPTINDAGWKNLKTPLIYAAEAGHSNVVAALLTSRAIKIQQADHSEHSALQYAARNGHLASVEELLKNENTDPNFKTVGFGDTPLCLAALNGHEAIVKLLMNRSDISINCRALPAAASNDYEDIVKLLLDHTGIDVNAGNPLASAAAVGHEAIVRLLLRQDGVRVNKGTPLSRAAAGGFENIVKILLEHDGTHINFSLGEDSTDINIPSPLAAAAIKGHEAITKLLLSQPGIDIMLDSPLIVAAFCGHYAIVALLLKHNGGPDVNANTMLLPRPGGNIDFNSNVWFSRLINPITALSCAASMGHEKIVKLLLEQDGIYFFPSGPLAFAAANGHEDIVKLLLARAPASIDNGESLVCAAAHGFENIVRLLLKYGFDVNSKENISEFRPPSYLKLPYFHSLFYFNPDREVYTPLAAAAGAGHDKVVKLLLEQHAIDLVDGSKLLKDAAQSGRENIVEILLKQSGIDIDVNKLLLDAARNGRENIVKVLLRQNDIDIDVSTVLLTAVENGHKNVVKVLLEQNDIDVDANELPNAAAAEDRENVAEFLLRSAFNPDPSLTQHPDILELLLERSDYNITASDFLHASILHHHVDTLKMLLTKGASPHSYTNGFLITALQLAIRSHNGEIVDLFLKYDGICVNISRRRDVGKLGWKAVSDYAMSLKYLFVDYQRRPRCIHPDDRSLLPIQLAAKIRLGDEFVERVRECVSRIEKYWGCPACNSRLMKRAEMENN